MTPVEITIPIRTPNPTNGSHKHWSATYRVRKAQRTTALLVVRSSLAAARITPPCIVTMTRVAPGKGLDDDNVRPALKSIRDGIADALGVDDGSPLVEWRYAQRRGPWAVEVRMEAPAAGPAES